MAYHLASAYVDVKVHSGGLHAVFGQIESGLHNIIHGVSELSPLLGLTAGITSVTLAFHEFMQAAGAAFEAEVRLESIIRATGEAAHITAEEVLEMSTSLQNKGIFSNTAITRATTSLLQLRAVTRETFPEIIKLSEDVAAAGFGSVESAAMTLGRALADPARGLYRLRSIGIIFTKSEQDKIHALAKANDMLSAQRIILNKVRDSVGGTNEALAKTPYGQLKQVKNLFENIAEYLGKKIYPAVVDVAQWALYLTRPLAKILGFVFDINQMLGNWPVKIALAGALAYGLTRAFSSMKLLVATVTHDIFAMIEPMRLFLFGYLQPVSMGFVRMPGLIEKVRNALVSMNVATALSSLVNPYVAVFAIVAAAIAAIAITTYLIYKYLAKFPEFVEAMASYWDAASIIVENIWQSVKEIAEIVFYIGVNVIRTFAPWIEDLPIIKTLLERGIVPVIAMIIDMLTDGMLQVGAMVKTIAIQVEDLAYNIRLITSGNAGALFGGGSVRNPLASFNSELEFMRYELAKRKEARNRKKEESRTGGAIGGGPLSIKGGLSGLSDAWKNVQDAILAKESPAERTAKGIESLDATADSMLETLLSIDGKVGGGAVATV